MASSSKMATRNWDELNNDCLTQIFAKVETKSLVRFIPFVCKSWYHATFDPQCWTTLIFPYAFDLGRFLKYAVGRSQRSATAVVFQPVLSRRYLFRELRPATCDCLLCIAEGCPLLKTLILPQLVERETNLLLSELIVNWKHLEYLQLSDGSCFQQIMESISLHCDNFVSLVLSFIRISNQAVSVIVKFTPKIKFLSMRQCWLSREGLVIVLKGCTALETLDVSDCIGFNEGDHEIMKLASHIKYFNCSGARALMFEDDESDSDTYNDVHGDD